MRSIGPEQATPRLRQLFDPADPAMLRCFAVLDGATAGTILTDSPAAPTWAVVREAGDDGATFLGGALDAPAIGRIVDALRDDGAVLIGFWPDDQRLALLPADPDYDGWVLEWIGRSDAVSLEPFLGGAPTGCQVLPIDRQLLDRCAGRDGVRRYFGSAERFFERGLGFCLLDEDRIACEVFVTPAVDGLREIWVETHAPFRRKGYAAITCAHAIRACERAGQQTYWNTAMQNHASAALARKLGYGSPREYRLLAWSQPRG